MMAGFAACNRPLSTGTVNGPTALAQVPAVRLNFRYEADVPGPGDQAAANPQEERNAAIQADFDQNRLEEILDKTISSPDKKRVIAVYHRALDTNAEYRLDMYQPDGKLLQKITPDSMAAHFPDTISWAPDSSSLAFVAMIRAGQTEGSEAQTPPPVAPQETPADADANANMEGTQLPAATPTPAPPAAVLTFRTEQIYLCDQDGGALKPITQSEGKIYFYYIWSPDSSMLATLVTTSPEWNSMQMQAQSRKELFVPAGRPRLVEKNGRERLLDDAMTIAHPVWSPDSSKIAAAFDTQIRIYDAVGNAPTQAGIPLRNQLLISSQAYDKQLEQQATAENSVANVEQPGANNGPTTTTLPDPSKLVSFNPIVELQWTSDDILYFQTGYVRQYENPVDNRSSFLRWHRLIFSPQPSAPAR
jgi:Tol biopolymer transport system component